MPSLPFVSCIMPTRNRRRFVGQSIRYFLRQEYPRCELIIVDDGEDAVADVVPSEPRIRYVHLGRRVPLGAKRNVACEMSRGELIAHWDDDDWIAPSRLQIEVGCLLSSGAGVCGIRDLLHYRVEAGDAWLYRCRPGQRPWVAGCTLLYRRTTWAEHPFLDINEGEDTAFVYSLPPHRVCGVEDTSFYVALIHAGNTGLKHLGDPHWERCSLEKVSQLLAHDGDFYSTL